MKYIKRSPAERLLLRRKFESVRKEFLKQVAKHPDVKKRSGPEELERMAPGRNPAGWEVHHKLPLDDSGTKG